MIDLEKAKKAFKDYLQSYDNQDDHGFNLKIVHTYHVVENAENISKALSLSEEDIKLACVIALLHDLGRFDELKNRKRFDSVGNDHALFATKLLFEEGLITQFVDSNEYNNIIKKAIENHNKKIQQCINKSFRIREIENKHIFFFTEEKIEKYVQEAIDCCEEYFTLFNNPIEIISVKK